MDKGNKFLRLGISVLVCQLAGAIGALFTSSAIPTWYATLQKPGFSPPNWIFAPVWTLLYLLMGVSLYLVWNNGLAEEKTKKALFVFALQLVLNIAWSFLFFGLHSPALALAGIIVLWLAILLTMIKFYAVSKTAACILLPYLLWVSFATILNFSVLILN